MSRADIERLAKIATAAACEEMVRLNLTTVKSEYINQTSVRAILTAMRTDGEQFADHPMFQAPREAGVTAGDYDMAAHEAENAWNAMIDHLLADD